jgi:hypothetical protein
VVLLQVTINLDLNSVPVLGAGVEGFPLSSIVSIFLSGDV